MACKNFCLSSDAGGGPAASEGVGRKTERRSDFKTAIAFIILWFIGIGYWFFRKNALAKIGIAIDAKMKQFSDTILAEIETK